VKKRFSNTFAKRLKLILLVRKIIISFFEKSIAFYKIFSSKISISIFLNIQKYSIDKKIGDRFMKNINEKYREM